MFGAPPWPLVTACFPAVDPLRQVETECATTEPGASQSWKVAFGNLFYQFWGTTISDLDDKVRPELTISF